MSPAVLASLMLRRRVQIVTEVSHTQVSAVIFGFLNVARALVPVRIALTLGTAPLVDKYIVQRFGLDKKKEEGADA